MMKRIARGERKATALDSIILKHDTTFQKNSIRMYFTSNHDENSWNKADFATMPGDVHAPFAVLTQTIKRTVPLIYGGQEEPFLDSLKFFVKDTIIFGNYKRQEFYKKLLTLRKENAALAPNSSYTKLTSTNDANIFAFVRSKEKNKIMVVTNLSSSPQNFTLSNDLINGDTKELFTSSKQKITSNQTMTLPAWGYAVYVY